MPRFLAPGIAAVALALTGTACGPTSTPVRTVHVYHHAATAHPAQTVHVVVHRVVTHATAPKPKKISKLRRAVSRRH